MITECQIDEKLNTACSRNVHTITAVNQPVFPSCHGYIDDRVLRGGWGVDLGILTKVTLLVPSINYHFFINGVSKIIITCLLATVQIDMFYTSQRLVHAHSKRVS